LTEVSQAKRNSSRQKGNRDSAGRRELEKVNKKKRAGGVDKTALHNEFVLMVWNGGRCEAKFPSTEIEKWVEREQERNVLQEAFYLNGSNPRSQVSVTKKKKWS